MVGNLHLSFWFEITINQNTERFPELLNDANQCVKFPQLINPPKSIAHVYWGENTPDKSTS